MKFSSRKTFVSSLLVLLTLGTFPLAIYARGDRAGSSSRVNSSVSTQNRGNISSPSRNNANVNRANVNNANVNRTNVNNANVNRNNNVNVNRNTNVNINNNNNSWRGGGWNGGGYVTPPGWGLVGFATGLVVGAALSTPPPYSVPVIVGSNNFIYSDGVFLQPSGGQYIVVRPPIGAVVPSIPDGCTAKDNSGVVLYDCSGVIYQPFYQGNDLVYKVIRV
jgi:hypothetical protein